MGTWWCAVIVDGVPANAAAMALAGHLPLLGRIGQTVCIYACISRPMEGTFVPVGKAAIDRGRRS